MKSEFSERELKERALELLYGLLDRDEAEETRRLIASDATAARLFDEARETVELLKRAARWEEPESENDEATAKNVAVETAAFDDGASFFFAAAGAPELNDASRGAESAESGGTAALVENASSGSNRRRAKRRLNLMRKSNSAEKTEKLEKAEKAVKREKTAKRAPTSFGAEVGNVGDASAWATVGRTARGSRRSTARRLSERLPRTTLFQKLIVALVLVALTTTFGFWAQETALQARFRDDFRIQIAAPPTLARGASQTISATTTGPNGKPRRVPIRFSFSDAATGEPLLAHTESGDASGFARFKIPDVADFPERTLLTISAGERETETVETILTVVDAPTTGAVRETAFMSASKRREVGASRKEEAASKATRRSAGAGDSPVVFDAPETDAAAFALRETAVVAAADAGGVSTFSLAEPVESSESLKSAGSRLDVRFYPEGGRLVAGRECVLWFKCVDDAGRSVVGEFALNDSEGRVATAKTSEAGVGSFRWTPDADETYSLETAFDGATAKIVEDDEIDETDKIDGDDAAVKAEPAARDASGAPAFETLVFPTPTASVERIAFSLASPILESGRDVVFDVWAESDVPLAATVEKNGVALAQRVWTAKRGRRRVALPVEPNVSGALTVSLWNCERTPFEKLGAATVYRKPTIAPSLDAALERDAAGRRSLRLAVEPETLGDAKSVRIDAFWAPTLDAALGSLELDETLLYADDERRAETLGTLVPSEAQPPILFDNLLEMKARTLEKLNAFWLREAPIAERVVRLGFVGCGVLALLTTFWVVFGALKASRGAVVALFCVALATFFYFERRRIDFSESLSAAIAVSVDETRAARAGTNGGAGPSAADLDGGAEKTARDDARNAENVLLWRVETSKTALDSASSFPLEGALATTEAGAILTKIEADGVRAWAVVSLSDDAEETTSDR